MTSTETLTAPAAALPAAPTSPTTAAPARPRLTLSRTERKLAGVAGGLAEHTGVDAVLWRVAFLGLTLAGGAGFVVYGLLWLLMPQADQSR